MAADKAEVGAEAACPQPRWVRESPVFAFKLTNPP